MLALLEARSFSLADGIDLLLGAIDAHLHPQFGTSKRELSERILLMLKTLRASLLTMFCAYSGFIIAGVGFQKMTEYDDFVDAAQSHALIGTSFTLVVIGATLALLAALVGGLPIVFTIVKAAFATRRIGHVLLLAAPLLLFALLSVAPPIVGSLPMIAARGLFVTILVGFVALSAGAICVAVTRSQIPDSLLRFAMFSSTVLTGSMVLMLIATIVWGIGLQQSVPQLFGSNEGIMASSTAGTWIGIVAGMALTTIVALVALIRGLRSQTASQITT
jgi:hypothetical protein